MPSHNANDDVDVVDTRDRSHARARRSRAPSPRRPGSGANHRPRRVLVVAAVLVVGWLAFMIWVPFHAWAGVQRVDASPAGDRPV